MRKSLFLVFSLAMITFAHSVMGQEVISGSVIDAEGSPIPFASVALEGTKSGTYTNELGEFEISFENEENILEVSSVGFFKYRIPISSIKNQANLRIELIASALELNQVVVTGNMKQTFIKESPVKVEVLTSTFLAKSPTNNIVEAIQTVNGVQEQVNCGVCGTNDIHINGMEGPYTLMLIDGMPIMSSLASVYGFNGIPTALVDRIEIIKGPSSTLYGTEAVGGVINILTKSPEQSPKFLFNTYMSSHLEWNMDLGSSFVIGENTDVSIGVNTYFNQYRFDFNNDNFTDIPLNKRLTLYNKWVFRRKHFDPASIAFRYYTEDRFGGVMEWQPEDRGSDSVYGESIRTNRFELIGDYQLPINAQRVKLSYSFTYHNQDSYYGTTNYGAEQFVLFSNLIWDKKIGKHDLLGGLTIRNDIYRDNTVAQADDNRWTPGLFIQDEWRVNRSSTLLSGIRFDHHNNHGIIVSPRINFKQKLGEFTSVRLNLGTGFRRVNLFTEDHAALTGSREVIIANELKPESSYNVNLNINHVFFLGESTGTLDLDGFYTYFNNKIVPDYETDSRYIIYDNLGGHGITRGMSLSISQSFIVPLNYSLGITLQDVYEEEVSGTDGNTIRTPQLFAPVFSGTFAVSYNLRRWDLSLDYTGKIIGPQHLPTYEPPYERPEKSPWSSIHNIQMNKKIGKSVNAFIAVKNLFNWTQNSPLIAPEDPFGPDFDTSYAWGPLQPRRIVVGVKFQFE